MSAPAIATAMPTAIQNLMRPIRSDDLPKFTTVLRQMSPFKDYVEGIQVVLDANVVTEPVEGRRC